MNNLRKFKYIENVSVEGGGYEDDVDGVGGEDIEDIEDYNESITIGGDASMDDLDIEEI